MNALLFDTLKLAKRLEQAGFSREQAAGAAEAISEGISAEFATKSDMADLRRGLAKLSTELRSGH